MSSLKILAADRLF